MLVRAKLDEAALQAAVLKALREREDWGLPQLLKALVDTPRDDR